MFLKKNTKKDKGKEYYQYVLVESVRTPNGPRHKSIVSLGDLSSRPAKEWLKLVRKVEEALAGQLNIFEESDKEVLDIVEKIKKRRQKSESKEEENIPDEITVYPKKIETEEHREFGPEFVVSYLWDLMNFDKILKEAGLSSDACKLTLISVANRLIFPSSDFSIPDWAKATAICELASFERKNLNDDRFYRLLDKLYPRREKIEKALHERELDIFNLELSLLFIDFTSFYFEGSCGKNKKAKRGYSRDKRPDCKQLVLGAAISREGFPIASEIFEGNANDSATFPVMLEKINKRVDTEGKTLIFDRGIATKKNMEFLKSHEKRYNWIVASSYWESEEWVNKINQPGWKEIPLNGKIAGRKNPKVKLKLFGSEEEQIVLVFSEGRKEKDRAIRERQEKKMEEEFVKLSKRITFGKLKDNKKIWQAVGRLKERYPRVNRYYKTELKGEENNKELLWSKNDDQLKKAEEMDGCYLLRTNGKDMELEEIFRTYILLSRIENLFKDLKGPVKTHPNRHHRDDRSESHIFQSVLALHVLTAIEHRMKENGDTRSWETIRDRLRTHQTCSIVLPAVNGKTYHIRKPSKMEDKHHEIYCKLGIISSV